MPTARPIQLVGFNPLPPFSGGRTTFRSGRASYSCGFNPLPPFSGGRTICPIWQFAASIVSIRSRHFQAGEQTPRSITICSRVFQSAPAIFRRENYTLPLVPRSSHRFNPLPPFSGGRTVRELLGTWSHASFNPLPPFSGGRTTVQLRLDRTLNCFNPLPPFSGGRTYQPCHLHRRELCFNPLPPFSGGRTLTGIYLSVGGVFQSAPAIFRRENSLDFASALHNLIVSIRSRHFQAGEQYKCITTIGAE